MSVPAENEEVIAEDYDEMETEDKSGPEKYHHLMDSTNKRTEDNFWLERMRARMGEGSSVLGYKGCPNKYNIWHKCTLYCVNRWEEGKSEPSHEYLRRYKRLRRKYPLPKGWNEVYDPGCAAFYFVCATENLVSWLPPTHPKSVLTKSAAYLRKQMEDNDGGEGNPMDDDEEEDLNDGDENNASSRHQKEVDDIINASMRSRSPPPALNSNDFPDLGVPPPRKQKSRDLDRALSRQQRSRDRGYERDDRNRDRDRYSNRGNRYGRGGGGGRGESDLADPMDPSSYSDIPLGKWSDGLDIGRGEKKRETSSGGRENKRNERSDEEDDDADYR